MLPKIPRFVLAALMFAFAAPLAGCEYEEAEYAETGYAYQPAYYNGYVVYYDTAGLPYYYIDGSMYYVPRSYVYYGALCDHYRYHRPYYERWYVSEGHRYTTYHSASPGSHVVSAPPSSRVYRPATPSPRVTNRSAPRAVPRHMGGSGGRVRFGGSGRGHFGGGRGRR